MPDRHGQALDGRGRRRLGGFFALLALAEELSHLGSRLLKSLDESRIAQLGRVDRTPRARGAAQRCLVRAKVALHAFAQPDHSQTERQPILVVFRKLLHRLYQLLPFGTSQVGDGRYGLTRE